MCTDAHHWSKLRGLPTHARWGPESVNAVDRGPLSRRLLQRLTRATQKSSTPDIRSPTQTILPASLRATPASSPSTAHRPRGRRYPNANPSHYQQKDSPFAHHPASVSLPSASLCYPSPAAWQSADTRPHSSSARTTKPHASRPRSPPESTPA